MSNPIKSLLPTPLTIHLISDINCLTKLPLPLFKFLIDSALSLKTSTINIADQSLLKNVLLRQNIPKQILSSLINSVKLFENIQIKVLKLMKISEPGEIQTNLQNCQKYLANVLSQNTLLESTQISYLIKQISLIVHKSLQSHSNSIQTNLGTVNWSIYNLKKTNLKKSPQNTTSNQSEPDNSASLKTINKMYVKVSFAQNFSSSQVQKLIGSAFQPDSDTVIEANFHSASQPTTTIHKNQSKTIVMSLIDFRLFMEELEKVKNLNY